MSAVSDAAPTTLKPVAPSVGWSDRWRTQLEVLSVVVVALVIFFLVRPMLWGHHFIGFDWYTHLWYIWHQEGSIKQNLVPSLYNFNQTGVFDPHFAFYGGTLYVLAALISLVVGHVAAFAITWIMAFVMAEGGFYWLARQAGAGPVVAHAPGVLFISSAWWLSGIYAWGSWGQAVAVASLPLVAASAIAVLRADRLRLGPAAALAFSTLMYTGSHNLTMLWASTLSAIVLVVLFAVVPAARRLVFQKAGLKRLALVMVPAVLVNAWFLLPDVLYQGQTLIATNATYAEGLVTTSMNFVEAKYLFSIKYTNGMKDFTHQSAALPLLGTVWSAVAVVLALPSWRSMWLRLALVAFAVMVVVWQIHTRLNWILALPSPYDRIQAPYRLQSYITLGMGFFVVCALALMARTRDWRRWWLVALVPAVLVTVLSAKALVDQPLGPFYQPPWKQPRAYWAKDEPPFGAADYVDGRLDVVQVDPTMPRVQFDAKVAQDRHKASAQVLASPGQYVASNLKAATWLVKVDGARIVAMDNAGNAILEVQGQPDAKGNVTVTAQAKSPWPVVGGRILTLLGLLGLAFGAVRLLRSRPAEHESAPPAPPVSA
ncbi:MAG TPA: hypothetical protein VFG42_03880 [Baekduia sp.]|uniref:hypothetical protein n=1 Tax=Baekduia sp. TaxID=2600305 RepID=UPI002D7990D2|nr:hypothetical protein [Baekduia sp.]HET6505903.1 hypothetical protein [Baekduia sp.]